MPRFLKQLSRSGEHTIVIVLMKKMITCYYLRIVKRLYSFQDRTKSFSLKRYRDELGKDYAKIVLYLCTRSDYNKSEGNKSEEEGEIEEYDDVKTYPTPCLGSSSNQTTSKNRTIEDYFSCDDGNETMPDSEDSGPSCVKRFKREPESDLNCKTDHE